MNVIVTGNGPRQFVESGLFARESGFTEIPVIDFAPMYGDDAAAQRTVAAALRDACVNVGFFYLVGHGVPQAVVDAVFAQAHRFFDLPDAEKMAIHVSRSKNNRGYGAMLDENTDPTARGDLHEAFDLALDIPADDPDVLAGKTLYGPNLWPEGMPGFREDLMRYHGAIIAFGRHLFRAFAMALDLPEDFFDDKIARPLATMRILHYPPQFGTIDEKQIGIGAHSDYECFTILAQDEVGALQVLNARGEWIAAPPMPGAFVVNIGDMMARWTNDYFASTIHRAINRSGRRRYSIPFFYGPDWDTIVECLPSCTGPDRPARYAPVKAGDYVVGRFSDTYGYIREREGKA